MKEKDAGKHEVDLAVSKTTGHRIGIHRHDVINDNAVDSNFDSDEESASELSGVISGMKLKSSPSDLANNNSSEEARHVLPDKIQLDFDDDFEALENDIIDNFLSSSASDVGGNDRDENARFVNHDATVDQSRVSLNNEPAGINTASTQELLIDDITWENKIFDELTGAGDPPGSEDKPQSEEDLRVHNFLQSPVHVTSDIFITIPRAAPSQFAALTMNLSFAGCGFLGIYHLGVVHSMAHHGQKLLLNVQRFGGASAGSLIASALAIRGADKQVIQECVEFCYNLAETVRSKKMGVLTPRMSLLDPLRTFLDNMLPEDAHVIAKNRLFVSVTDTRTRKNHLFCDFESKEHLIQYLLGSSYVPFLTGTKPVKIGSQKYMDGGMTNNLPDIPHGRTILISPFSGRQHISPRDKSGRGRFVHIQGEDFQVSTDNLKRGLHAFSPPKRKYMERYFERGKQDCIRFLKKEHFYEAAVPDQDDASISGDAPIGGSRDPRATGRLVDDAISEASFSQANTVDTEVDDIQSCSQDINRNSHGNGKQT